MITNTYVLTKDKDIETLLQTGISNLHNIVVDALTVGGLIVVKLNKTRKNDNV